MALIRGLHKWSLLIYNEKQSISIKKNRQDERTSTFLSTGLLWWESQNLVRHQTWPLSDSSEHSLRGSPGGARPQQLAQDSHLHLADLTWPRMASCRPHTQLFWGDHNSGHKVLGQTPSAWPQHTRHAARCPQPCRPGV